MKKEIEYIHTPENDPKWNMPYAPAIKVHSGKTVWIAGVTAAPIYHSHPHIQAEFDQIPADAAQQAEMTIQGLQKILHAAGGDLTDVVQLFRFIVDIDKNQDAINATLGRHFGSHRPVSTTVEVVRLATDPRLVLELAAVAVVPE